MCAIDDLTIDLTRLGTQRVRDGEPYRAIGIVWTQCPSVS